MSHKKYTGSRDARTSIDNNHRITGERFVEITDNEMVIHQGGIVTQTYPLRFLRRYGFEETSVFRFEAGRKCPTGPGLYTFKCPQAERLFNYLQNHIQMRSNSNDDSISHRSHDGNNSSTAHTLRSNRTSRLNSTVSNGALSPTLPLSPPANCYVNDMILHTELDNRRPEQQDKLLNNNHIANMYVNLDFGVNSPLSPTFSTTDGEMFPSISNNNEDEPSHNYANINPDYDETVLTPSTTKPPVAPLNFTTPVNYLVLELGNPSPTPTSPLVPPESPNKPTGGYATIDFNKTTALSHAVSRSMNSEDINECSRKTRHNSSISDSFSFVKSGSDS
ncbi:fibroblast growth factor receptor substrate 2 [Diaphorina citri]|uniref:Fibroblast growth factor receptor substrate 2 n=1 Tax=Diaphorina citri TaxID=121845 RepID=A0A1S3DB33_DIACI|nr:fibroblast growth factor receptor substrate 2 [Diaphorina citri]